jgi:hypothetical protein
LVAECERIVSFRKTLDTDGADQFDLVRSPAATRWAYSEDTRLLDDRSHVPQFRLLRTRIHKSAKILAGGLIRKKQFNTTPSSRGSPITLQLSSTAKAATEAWHYCDVSGRITQYREKWGRHRQEKTFGASKF